MAASQVCGTGTRSVRPSSAVRSNGFMALLASHDAPELLRIAQRAGGDQIQSVALDDGHLHQQRQSRAVGQEAAAHVGDDTAVGGRELVAVSRG